jgi:hypothetical protein
MLTEICASASGNRARSAGKVEVQSRVLSPRIYDPLSRVSAVPEVARMLLFRRERSSNGS